MGRPSKITQTIVSAEGREPLPIGEAIAQAMRAGAYLEDAAESVGVATSTVYNWLARGDEHAYDVEAGETIESVPEELRPYVELSEAVERARAQAVVFNLATIRKAAQEGSWQAAAWFLERTRPDQYGRRTVLEHEGGVPMRPEPVDLSHLTDEELAQLEELQAKAREGGA